MSFQYRKVFEKKNFDMERERTQPLNSEVVVKRATPEQLAKFEEAKPMEKKRRGRPGKNTVSPSTETTPEKVTPIETVRRLTHIEFAENDLPFEDNSDVDELEMIDHPPHYTAGGIECIDAIMAAVTGLSPQEAVCVANVLKYTWRFKHKNGKQDLHKAEWYLKRLADMQDEA